MKKPSSKITFDSMPEAIEQLMEQVACMNEKLDAYMSASPVTPSEFMNADEAAAMLQMTKKSLYFKTMNRTVPHHKRGKRLYFDRMELIKYIRNGQVTQPQH